MRSFNDTTGKEWKLAVTVAAVKRVRELTGCDLMQILSSEDTLRQLATDDILMVDVVFAILKTQADADGISDVQFGEAMAGDAISKAYEALIGELSDFSRNPKARKVMGKVWAKVQEVENKLAGIAEERLDSGELDKLIDRELKAAHTPNKESQPTGGESSGSSPVE